MQRVLTRMSAVTVQVRRDDCLRALRNDDVFTGVNEPSPLLSSTRKRDNLRGRSSGVRLFSRCCAKRGLCVPVARACDATLFPNSIFGRAERADRSRIDLDPPRPVRRRGGFWDARSSRTRLSVTHVRRHDESAGRRRPRCRFGPGARAPRSCGETCNPGLVQPGQRLYLERSRVDRARAWPRLGSRHAARGSDRLWFSSLDRSALAPASKALLVSVLAAELDVPTNR